MQMKCVCPNCYEAITVSGRRTVGWVACRCGHVFKLTESAEPVVQSPPPVAPRSRLGK